MEKITVINLRKVIRQHNLKRKIPHYSRMKRNDLINEINKHLVYDERDDLFYPIQNIETLTLSDFDAVSLYPSAMNVMNEEQRKFEEMREKLMNSNARYSLR